MNNIFRLRHLYAFIGFFLLSYSVQAIVLGDSLKNSVKANELVPKRVERTTEVGAFRTFHSLDFSDENTWYEDQDFLIPSNHEDTTVSSVIGSFRARAQALFNEVESARRFVDYLDETSLLQLPVGIKKTTGNLDYTILIDSMVLTPSHAYLTAYMVFTTPSTGRTIAFRGSGIKFSKKGGIEPGAKLQLLGDYALPFGEETMTILKGDGDTFVEFDCDGFKSMGIDAELLFSRNMIVPDSPSGQPGEGRVLTQFKTVLTDWNDFVVEVSLPDFQLNGLKGVGFKVNGAVFDFSDYRNGTSITFPADYMASIGLSGNANLWRGFFLRDLLISLPPEFKKSGQNTRTSFSAKNLIIDKQGVSGLFEADNLIQLSEGDIDGWAFSLTHFSMNLERGQLISGGFSGDIVIPISKESQHFAYSALINPGNEYVFSVATPDSLSFPMFSTSRVELLPSSSLEIRVADGKFLPRANLYGNMDINAALGGKEVSLGDIQFENLQIQSVKPYMQADYFSFGSEAAEQAMAGFPVQIKNIAFRKISDTQSGLEFDLLINVTESFSGESGLTLVGGLKSEGRSKWQFEKIQVNDISLDVKTAAFDFNGKLAFYRSDVTYGDGFNGNLKANFKGIGLEVQAGAIFGNVSGFRYWYVDAAASFSKGIPVSPGMEITGFGGGAYYRMGIDMNGTGSELGETRSGVVYVPKENYGIGFKASVEFAAVGGKAFNGDAALEMAFFKGGGLRYISFKGNGYFMTPPVNSSLAKIQDKAKKLGDAVSKMQQSGGDADSGLICQSNASDPNITNVYGNVGGSDGRGSMSAHVFISMDFENKVLHGNFEVYINVAGGIVKGRGDRGRAGWAVLHFAPDDWYIYIGTPDDRIGIKVGLGPVSAEANGYFMVGTSIPGSPPPPKEVSSILGGMDLDYMDDLNELGNGAGFAFGAAFKVDTGDLSFLMFYARFKAGAGFDIMLKDYGSASCEGSSKPIGINGWYANGQAYAYFDGKVGIKIRVFGRKKKIDILSIGAAAVLQAKLPNPFWMRGVVGGRFSILGGLVKGNCKFQVTIGKECEIDGGSVLEGVQVIADLTPVDGETDVNVFTTPQAIFNLPVEKVFEMMDLDDQLKKFRVRLDYFKLSEGSNVINGELEWNSEKDILVFNAHDVFPSKKKMVAQVQVSFEEYKSGNWIAVVVDGKKYVESKFITFTSGVAPNYIPLDNVEYSYPIVNQLNFYKDESDGGYIKLKRGQPDLFNVGAEWNQKGRFISKTGNSILFDFDYSEGNRRVDFSIPQELNVNEIYSFELVNLPAITGGDLGRNVKTDSSRVVGDGSTTVATRKAEGNIMDLQEKSIFETHIRTSQYSTFENKIRAQSITRTSREIYFLWEGLYINNSIEIDEAYSKEELGGNMYTNFKPMVKLSADLQGNKYFEESIQPLIYADYPIDGDIRITNRNVDSLGVVPTKAVKYRQQNYDLTLRPSDISAGTYSFTNQNIRIQYLLSPYMYFDFKEIQAKVVQRYVSQDQVRDRISRLLWGQFPVQSGGNYNIKAAYYLPGEKEPNSEVNISTILKLD